MPGKARLVVVVVNLKGAIVKILFLLLVLAMILLPAIAVADELAPDPMAEFLYDGGIELVQLDPLPPET